MYDVAQIYGDHAVVRGNAQVRGCAWVLGVVEDSAVADDLAIVCEGSAPRWTRCFRYGDVARSEILPQKMAQLTKGCASLEKLALVKGGG